MASVLFYKLWKWWNISVLTCFVFILFIELKVTNLGARLALIEKKINENKDLISSSDATKSVNVLPEVAKLGSNYRDLSDSVKSLKDVTNSLKLYQTTLSSNITSINVCDYYCFIFIFYDKLLFMDLL